MVRRVWRNRQTRQAQDLVARKSRGGSNPLTRILVVPKKPGAPTTRPGTGPSEPTGCYGVEQPPRFPRIPRGGTGLRVGRRWQGSRVSDTGGTQPSIQGVVAGLWCNRPRLGRRENGSHGFTIAAGTRSGTPRGHGPPLWEPATRHQAGCPATSWLCLLSRAPAQNKERTNG